MSADELGRRAQVEAAGIQGANQMAVERQRGLSQLANTRIAGQTQMAVEDLRQSGPEKALRATKIQGEIEDEKAARAARNGLLSAINSGDPGKISKAWRMGIAAGVVKPEQQEKATPYKFHTDAEGRSVRINEATGATDVLDRADGTYKPVRTSSAPDVEAIKQDVAAGIAQGKSKSAMAERLASMGLKPGDFGL